MQEESLDRVRDDLTTIRAAIGGPAFGATDVAFFAGLSIACGVFSAAYFSGAQAGWPFWVSAAPAVVVFVGYLGFLTANSRRGSGVEAARRREYHTSLLVLLPVVIAAPGLRYWADQAGMTRLQLGGVICIVVGCAVVLFAVSQGATTRYPRSYYLAGGSPLIVCGLLFPFCSQAQAMMLVGAMGAAIFGLLAIAMHLHLRGKAEEATDAGA